MKVETVIRELRRIMTDSHRCFGCGHEHSCSVRGCAIMRNAADMLEKHRWIPVTERLPESGTRVIVCRGDKVEQGVFLGVNGWWKVYGTNTKKVTHWMPMPEPPEVVKK